MKRFLLLLVFVAITFVTSAQESFKFGKITKADLLKTDYPIAAEADAVVLDELQQTIFYRTSHDRNWLFKEDGHMSVSYTTISRKLKILHPEGSRHAKVYVDCYYSDKEYYPTHTVESISAIEAYSYTLRNGKVVKSKLNDKDVKTTILNDTTARVEFTIPNVCNGSIIEYEYSLLKQSVRTYCIDFPMQHDIPVLSSRCVVAADKSISSVKMREDNWYGIVKSGNNLINTTQTDGVYIFQPRPASTHIYQNIEIGMGSIDRIKSNCKMYHFSSENLPAVPVNVIKDDVAAIKVILFEDK